MKNFQKNERIDRTILSIIQNALNQNEKYVNVRRQFTQRMQEGYTVMNKN